MSSILIMMSTYNGEKYLRPQLDSILNQKTQHDIHLYIRDDASTDTTRDILNEYASKYPNITLEFGKNMGSNASFLSMLEKANGYDYYGYSDQDDIWLEDKVEIAIESIKPLDNTKPCMYCSCSELVDDEYHHLGLTQINRRGMTFNNVIIQNLCPGHAMVFNNEAVKLFTSHYPIDYTRIDVHDYWLAMHIIAFGELYYDNIPHTYYRQHNDNVLGYSHGLYGWLVERIHRVQHSMAKLITKQNLYFYELYKNDLTNDQVKELKGMLYSQRNILTRSIFLLKTKVYRQKKFETMLFYILYLFGGYKI